MKKRYLKASFSIEASYILFIIFISIANLILYVHREKIYTSSAYLIHQMAENLSVREEVFDIQEDFDKEIQEKYKLMQEDIESGDGVSLTMKRNIFKVETRLISPRMDLKVEQKIFKPIEFMRLITALKGVIDEK